MSTSEAVLRAVTDLVSTDDVAEITQLQESMLQKFEKTNAMLHTVSQLSVERYKVLSDEMIRHTQRIRVMKKDLDSIFKRISSLKRVFSAKYPEEMQQLDVHLNNNPDSDDDPPLQPITVNSPTVSIDVDAVASKKMETVREETHND